MILLAGISVLHALAPFVLMGSRLGLGYDETVYLSQINHHVPPGYFSAPRARGLPILVAPVTAWTASVFAIRVYLGILSGFGLYLAFCPWLRLRPGYIAPTAAGLFSTLWVSVYYGYQAMPNEWVAYGAVAAAGTVALAWSQPRRRYLVAIAFGVAAVTLVRPADGLFLTLGLGIVVLVGKSPRRRSVSLLGVLLLGLAVGWGEWIVEAFAYFSGPIHRLHAAGAENGGGLNFALAAQARALAGPTLCRHGCQAHTPWIDRAWWLAVALLAIVALWTARVRRTPGPPVTLPLVAGIAMVVEYTVTVNYAAPRFLLPAYALFAVPCAEGAASVCRWASGPPGNHLALIAVIVTATCLVAIHVVIQAAILRRDILPASRADKAQYLSDASTLRSLGLRRPCLVIGPTAGQISYVLGCRHGPTTASEVLAAHQVGVTVGWILPSPLGSQAFPAPTAAARAPGRRQRHLWFGYVLRPLH